MIGEMIRQRDWVALVAFVLFFCALLYFGSLAAAFAVTIPVILPLGWWKYLRHPMDRDSWRELAMSSAISVAAWLAALLWWIYLE